MSQSMMSKIILSCKKAAELTDKKMLVELSFIEAIQLRVHLLLCDCSICQSYQKYSELIDKAVDQINHENSIKKTLSPEKKEEIINSITHLK